MPDLRILLENSNIRQALVVDDAYDQVPLASDMSLDMDEWAQFFEDILEEDLATLREIYPCYDEFRADELRTSDSFVATLWQHRNRLRGDLVDSLFGRYGLDTATDREHLSVLVNRLVDLGLTCETTGRQFKDKAALADLIIVDLYLGSSQDPEAINASIDGLSEVIATRPDQPPLVVLMSRSSRLEEKREEFRDRSGLFESAFRIIRKAELADSGKLDRLLTTLASHYADSLKLVAFLHSWKTGLSQACSRTLGLIRKLDLPDHAQIRQLLLSAEGEPTGSYLVDVFDRVLQHEIEREASIIDAATMLNTLTSENYPPPYVAGSRNLQTLVYRSLFQHPERLRLREVGSNCIAFGDVLRRRRTSIEADGSSALDARAPLSDISETNVLAVLTPACDLQRRDARRILLLVGVLSPLQSINWSHYDQSIQTPIVELSDGQFWIKWDLKHIETISYNELDEVLRPADGFDIIARLRESHALELQQKLLASLGRVGQIAPMPATFHMQVQVCLPDKDQKLVPLSISALTQGGVCYVGRPEHGDRLVLSEDACEAICEAIESVDLAGIHPHAHEPITILRNSGELFKTLGRGVTLPKSGKQKDISLWISTQGNESEGSSRAVGLVMRNKEVGNPLQKAEVKKAGIVLVTWDSELFEPST